MDFLRDPNRMWAIHASAVQTDSGALIFLGPSGTGKSTMCQLLSRHTALLANDAVFLVPGANGTWGVGQGDRRACEGSLTAVEADTLRVVPLRVVLRLFQATAPHLTSSNALQTCQYLTDAAFEMAWQRDDYSVTTKKQLFADLAAACRLVPGYEFYFDLSLQTVEMLGTVIAI